MGLIMYRSRGSHQGTRASEDRVCKVSSDEPTIAVLLEMLCRRIKELLASVDILHKDYCGSQEMQDTAPHGLDHTKAIEQTV